MESKSEMLSREAVRAQLDLDVENFIKSGGKIKQEETRSLLELKTFRPWDKKNPSSYYIEEAQGFNPWEQEKQIS